MIECFAFIRFISGMELLTFAPGFSKLFGTQGASSSGSLLNLLSPRICFTRVVIMIYLFVLDDSLTRKRFTTRTERLTKCCEPLQKIRVRLGACKTGLSLPVILYF